MRHLETGHITLETASCAAAISKPIHTMKIVPASPTIEELTKQANDCNERGKAAPILWPHVCEKGLNFCATG